jgi:membrane protein DedA with SNARE-associated domain
MQQWIIDFMNQFGYPGIFLLIAIENLFPPIPSEVILTAGGFMTTYADITIWGVIIAATIGSVLGAIILYGAGRLLSAQRLINLLDGKLGRLLRFKKEDVLKAFDWFNRRGKSTVLICRCIPIVRSLISIPAGMSRMNLAVFLPLTLLGSLVWNTVLVYLGAAAGASYQKIVEGADVYKKITLVVLVVIALLVLAWYIRYRKKTKDSE